MYRCEAYGRRGPAPVSPRRKRCVRVHYWAVARAVEEDNANYATDGILRHSRVGNYESRLVVSRRVENTERKVEGTGGLRF